MQMSRPTLISAHESKVFKTWPPALRGVIIICESESVTDACERRPFGAGRMESVCVCV